MSEAATEKDLALWQAVDSRVSDLLYIAKCLDCFAMGLGNKDSASFHLQFADPVYFMSREVRRLADEIHGVISANGKEAAAS
jgi:hypothetical protein